MKQFVILSILLLSLVVGASMGLGQMQPPAQFQNANGLPDFSGFGLIDSFARLPAERTKLDRELLRQTNHSMLQRLVHQLAGLS